MPAPQAARRQIRTDRIALSRPKAFPVNSPKFRSGQPTRQASGAPALTPNRLMLQAIDPSCGAKFSPNLFEFLSTRSPTVFKLQRLFLDGHAVQWLGYFDDVGHFVGARLSQVLAQGKKVQVSCPVNLGDLHEVVGFWEQYLALGRCAIDPQHQTEFWDERWGLNAEGTLRSCLWCHNASQRMARTQNNSAQEQWVS